MAEPIANHPLALERYSVVDGGDIVGIMQLNGQMVRLPAWTPIDDRLILGAHPADTMPPGVDVIVNVDSFCFYELPAGVVYLHFAYKDMQTIPDASELNAAADFVNALRSAGKTVFIHCRLGLDRSALLTGIVLVRDGRRPEDAVRIMRERRSPYVLINKTFERYLLSLDQRDLSADSSSASRSVRSSRS
jgi:hypothetical protein